MHRVCVKQNENVIESRTNTGERGSLLMDGGYVERKTASYNYTLTPRQPTSSNTNSILRGGAGRAAGEKRFSVHMKY